MTFNELLSKLLEKYETYPEVDVDKLIAEFADENGLSDDAKKKIADVNDRLESMDAAYMRLNERKKNGGTRESWMQEEFFATAQRCGLDQEKSVEFVAAVTSAIDESLTETDV